jgi:hypothetical protein
MMTPRALALTLLVALASCATHPQGQAVMPSTVSDEIKTGAVRYALAEIGREGGGAGLKRGVYLDSAVGPTPEEFMYQRAHPTAWLQSIVAAGLVDGVFALPRTRSGLRQVSYTLEIGEPYPAGRDTVQIIYAWCARTFPTTPGSVAPGAVWRDALLPADTGWVRVGHAPTSVIGACGQ